LRSKEEFSVKHIQGAINIPEADITDEVLAKVIETNTKKLIVYDNQTLDPMGSVDIGFPHNLKFYQLGYKNLFMLERLTFVLYW